MQYGVNRGAGGPAPQENSYFIANVEKKLLSCIFALVRSLLKSLRLHVLSKISLI